MEEQSVLLCEIADEYLDSTENIDSNLVFPYGKRQWQIKTFLTEYANALIPIITNCKYIQLNSILN